MLDQLAAQWRTRCALRSRGTALVLRKLDRLERMITSMAVDRDLIAAAYQGLQTLAPYIENLITDNVALRRDNAELRGEAARDEEADAAELRPLVEIVTGLRDKLAPAVDDADAGPVQAPQSAADQVADAPPATPDTGSGATPETSDETGGATA